MSVDAVLRWQGYHSRLFPAHDRHELSVARHLRLLQLQLRPGHTDAGVAGHALRAAGQRGRHAVQSTRTLGWCFCEKKLKKKKKFM